MPDHRFRTAGGASVDLSFGFDSISNRDSAVAHCTGCSLARDWRTTDGETSRLRAGATTWAQQHAGACRATPRR